MRTENSQNSSEDTQKKWTSVYQPNKKPKTSKYFKTDRYETIEYRGYHNPNEKERG